MSQLSTYVSPFPCVGRPGYILLFSSVRGGLLVVPETLPDHLRQGLLDSDDVETLRRLGFLVNTAEDERQVMTSFLDAANSVRTFGDVIIIMNLDCNMACTYCYEGTAKGSNHYLSKASAEKVISFLEANLISRGRGVTLTFHGGEPLLSLPLLKDLAGGLKTLCNANNVPFSFTLITNGTLLTREVAQELLPLGFVGARVTLDGPRACHDHSRPFISGKGTFDLIMENLHGTWDLVRMQVGGNYTAENYRQFPSLLNELICQGLTADKIDRIQFSPVTATMKALTVGDFRSGCMSTEDPWLIEASIYLREEILSRGYRTSAIMPAACMIEFPDDIVINFDGKLYKCPAFIGDPSLSVGDVATGVQDYALSHDLGLWKNSTCLQCSYLPLCFGGCRYLQYLRTGSLKGIECRKEYYDATLPGLLLQDYRHLKTT